MLKYNYLDNQTLRVTLKRSFLVPGCMLVIFAFPIYALLTTIFCEKCFICDKGMAFIFAFILCLPVLSQLRAIYSGPDFFVDRDGSITAKRRTSYSTSRIETFEKGHYEFFVEERLEGEVYMVDGSNLGPYNEYTMIVRNENGIRVKLFAVETYGEIEEFKKRFSDFTCIV